MSNQMKIVIHHDQDITLEQVLAVGEKRAQVSLSPDTEKLLAERRQQIENFVHEQKMPAYGFNRGFGHNVDIPVEEDQLSELQENLIISHAVGMGEPTCDEIVRIIMLLRVRSLSRGYSGIRPLLIQQLLGMLEHDILPIVPEMGSVGASGDLAPLSHIALGMLGKGKVKYQGKVQEAAEALKAVGMTPLKLQMKEGLALTNGVQFMTAIGLYVCGRMKVLLKQASINTAMTAQVMLAPETPFREDLHQLRPHPGALKVAGWVFELMKNSPLREAHRDYRIDGEIQDPYNIRCAGQILGSCAELIDECETVLLREANSVTDNPILLPAKAEFGWVGEGKTEYQEQYVDVVSGGHFHGMPIATRLFGLFQAMGMMAGLGNQRCVRYVDDRRNKGLGRDLKWPGLNKEDVSISSGMMMPEYASAALANSIWGECMPSHLFNISTNTGQEDHVSMGAGLAVRLLKTLPRMADILAIEMAYISQAAIIRKELPYIPSRAPFPEEIKQECRELLAKLKGKHDPFLMDLEFIERYPLKPEQRKLNLVSEAVLEKVAEIFPTVIHDRYMSEQMRDLSTAIIEGVLVDIVEQQVPLV